MRNDDRSSISRGTNFSALYRRNNHIPVSSKLILRYLYYCYNFLINFTKKSAMGRRCARYRYTPSLSAAAILSPARRARSLTRVAMSSANFIESQVREQKKKVGDKKPEQYVRPRVSAGSGTAMEQLLGSALPSLYWLYL